jgi:hypothetical protein
MYVLFVLVFLLFSRVICGSLTVTDHCPLWHIKQNRVCQCGASIKGAVFCGGMDTIVIIPGYCMTWDNVTQNAVVNRLLISRQTGKGPIVGSALMDMDLLHFLMVLLVPTVLNIDTSGS